MGVNILNEIGEHARGKKFMIVSNPTVYDLYGKQVNDALPDREVHKILIPDGEKYKTFESVFQIYDALLENKFDRKSYIIALGGGVIGDLAGFAASTYMRGIPYIQVPTTLLAQVDSSIGGKVAVNHPKAKNMIGCFYQPEFVYSDIKTLETLPDKEFINGMAEVIKYGLIRDKNLFAFLDRSVESIKETKNISHIISRCAQIKANIVEKDEKEKDLRMILNFGHTIGHAIESVSQYKFGHGECVSLGMVAATKISAKVGLLKETEVNNIMKLINNYNLPTSVKGIDTSKIYETLQYDKKIIDNTMRFILLKSIGNALIYNKLSEDIVMESLNEISSG